MITDLTTAEVAQRLAVGKSTVQLWCKRGDVFPHARLVKTPRGDFYLIPASDLKDFTPPRMGRPPKPQPTKKSASGRRRRKEG